LSAKPGWQAMFVFANTVIFEGSEHPGRPRHPWNWLSDAGRASSCTTVPAGKKALHVPAPLPRVMTQLMPAGWDVIARAAGGAEKLVALVREAPDEADILPAPPKGQALSVEDVEAAPPAVLALLLRLLKEEVGAFERGREFNSGLSIHPGGLELRALRPMLTDEQTGQPLLKSKAVLVLDATPIGPLVDHLARGLVREPDFAPEVVLPPNVFVTQVADRFGGKSALNRTTASGRRPGRDALLASLTVQRERYPGDREAVICPKDIRDDVIAAGIAAERVHRP
jgi:hypothetical protein